MCSADYPAVGGNTRGRTLFVCNNEWMVHCRGPRLDLSRCCVYKICHTDTAQFCVFWHKRAGLRAELERPSLLPVICCDKSSLYVPPPCQRARLVGIGPSVELGCLFGQQWGERSEPAGCLSLLCLLWITDQSRSLASCSWRSGELGLFTVEIMWFIGWFRMSGGQL